MGCCQSACQGSCPGDPAAEAKASAPHSHRHAEDKVHLGKYKLIMGKYKMHMGKDDVMGEGTSSICRKGVNMETGEQVAIKVYKNQKDTGFSDSVKMQKFRRQVAVLKELQEPFVKPADTRLWHDELADVKPSRLFMQLIDYSKDAKGAPGPDPSDGVLYVVTELAQYSLKDFLALRRESYRPLPKDAVRHIAKALVLVMAGLHAKGLVHIDLKPENLMMFNGRLKLIDVDGCVKASSSVSIQDSSISFSPCYCAPEWARFLIEETENRIVVAPALDVWSVGMTICELVTLDAILKPMYANFLRNGHSHREAGFLFMEWLSGIKKAPLPKSIEKFDTELHELLVNWLLVCDPKKRKSCAECLSCPFIAATGGATPEPARPGTPDLHGSAQATPQEGMLDVNEKVSRMVRRRVEEDHSSTAVFKGTLWKLNMGGNIKDPAHWLKRDMWVANNGSLCYYSHKENKRLVLIDGSKLPGATIEKLDSAARGSAFQVKLPSDDHHEAEQTFVFSCESEDDYNEWTNKLRSAVNMDGMMGTMRLGNMADEMRKIKLSVKNRRMKVEGDSVDQFAPVFRGKLWKVKAEGDRMKEEDWFQREMWIAKNGSLVYFSVKEDRDLVYYTADDVAKASVVEIPDGDSFYPWAFQVRLPPAGDIEFTPGEFAAESQEMRQVWMEQFRKFRVS